MGTLTNGPLESLDQWDDDVRARYRADRKKEEFRVYDESTPKVVRDFYQQNHALQTLEFARGKRAQYETLQKDEMGIWEAMERLNSLVDDSDPDTDLSQIEHNLQTAEAIRADGHPRWFVLTGFIHDLGKVLTMWGEPQWAVVGDTFPVGCRWSNKIVYPEFFSENPDTQNPELMSRYGVYGEQCGLENVTLSWGHDEYLYHVTKNYLPEPAQYMIRYHSWYSAHREMDYQYLMSDHDLEMMDWVRKFNPYDLYSKSDKKPELATLKPYYDDLIAEFFPAKIRW
ncbi:MAG TPA: inositol oxygenase family protein [Bryobacteraceae bacterium]|nr:inositol oxygenase family protein [Bryobacteraceae bacterium]